VGSNAGRLNQRSAWTGEVLRSHVHIKFLRRSIKQHSLGLSLASLERHSTVANLAAAEQRIEASQRFVHYCRLQFRSFEEQLLGRSKQVPTCWLLDKGNSIIGVA
jgi:hypothetical protein